MSKKFLLAAALASALCALLWLLPRGACAALDCRRDYRSTAPDTIVDEDCGLVGGSVCLYRETKFWQVNFVDGYSEPRHPNATGMRIRHNPDFNCRPEFHEPTFQRLTGDKARWSQLVHHGILTPDAACVQSRTADEFVVIHKCFESTDTNNADICPGEATLGGAGGGGFLPNEDGGATTPDGMDCTSPVLVDVSGDGFRMTDAAGGVRFDLNGNGTLEGRLAWTAEGSDDAWLALDRDGDGRITSGRELFGNFTEQPAPPEGDVRNGFRALAEFDRPPQGGNSDGVIDERDAVFAQLRLWRDANHDGVSGPDELHALDALGVTRLHLSYKDSKRADEHGNRFKYRAKVDDEKGGKVNRWAWDVFLVTSP